MKPHLSFAHALWKREISPGDTLIDATVGNGHDTLYLATLLQGEGRLVGYDIQPQALAHTEARLLQLPAPYRKIVQLKLCSHACLEEKKAKLIVYNLGYLPSGNKACTTHHLSTLQSVQAALLISPAISITCYPGHREGALEKALLLEWISTLSPTHWSIHHYTWRESPEAPSLIWIRALLPDASRKSFPL